MAIYLGGSRGDHKVGAAGYTLRLLVQRYCRNPEHDPADATLIGNLDGDRTRRWEVPGVVNNGKAHGIHPIVQRLGVDGR